MRKVSFRLIRDIAALACCFLTFPLHEACAESPLISHDRSIPARDPAGSSSGQENFSNAVIRIAKDSIPAVVHIEVTESEVVESPALPFESDPFLRQFFNIPQMPKKFRRELKGIGTGMIINDRGFILTNYHVVAGADETQVVLPGGKSLKTTWIRTDKQTDLEIGRAHV